jgi:hypothetical protein
MKPNKPNRVKKKKKKKKTSPLVLNDRDSHTHVLGASAATYMAYMDHLP